MSDDLKYKIEKDRENRQKQRDNERSPNSNSKQIRNQIEQNNLSPNTSPPIRRSLIEEKFKDSNNNNYENNLIYSKIKVNNNTKLQINNNRKESNSGGTSKNNEKNSLKYNGDELNSFTNQDENNNNYPNNNSSCDKCSSTKEAYKKAISMIKNYVDCINERLNFIYHKVTPQKKTSSVSNFEMDYSISPEFYHTLYYSEVDKVKLSSEISFQLRSLMKSIRLFNDKYEYMTKKHENFEKIAQEYKNMKISNKTEDLKNMPEYDNEIKNMEVQKIFQNFNLAKENFENTLKDIKMSLNSNERNSIVNFVNDLSYLLFKICFFYQFQFLFF